MTAGSVAEDGHGGPPQQAAAAEVAGLRLIAFNLLCEAAAASVEAPELRAVAERAAAIEALLQQAAGEYTALA